MATNHVFHDLAYIGEQLRKIRKQRKKSQYELAEEINVSFNTISRVENAQSILDLEQLIRICYALETPVSELFPPSLQGISTNSDEDELMHAYNKLSDQNKLLVRNTLNTLIQGLLAQQILQ